MYEKLKKVQKLLWQGDDRMDQEVLFELQDMVAELLLDVAKAEKKVKDLLSSFPWLYSKGTGKEEQE